MRMVKLALFSYVLFFIVMLLVTPVLKTPSPESIASLDWRTILNIPLMAAGSVVLATHLFSKSSNNRSRSHSPFLFLVFGFCSVASFVFVLTYSLRRILEIIY